MAKSCLAAPALPLEFLWKSIHQNGLWDRTLRALQQDPEFPKARFRCHQIFLHKKNRACKFRESFLMKQ
jgi:hypothetical protein